MSGNFRGGGSTAGAGGVYGGWGTPRMGGAFPTSNQPVSSGMQSMNRLKDIATPSVMEKSWPHGGERQNVPRTTETLSALDWRFNPQSLGVAWLMVVELQQDDWVFEVCPAIQKDVTRLEWTIYSMPFTVMDPLPTYGVPSDTKMSSEKYETRMTAYGKGFHIEGQWMRTGEGRKQFDAQMYQMGRIFKYTVHIQIMKAIIHMMRFYEVLNRRLMETKEAARTASDALADERRMFGGMAKKRFLYEYVAQRKAMAKRQGVTFNRCIIPHGTADVLAFGDEYSLRNDARGPAQIERRLDTGGKVFEGGINGVKFMENSIYNLEDVPEDPGEMFDTTTQIGGYAFMDYSAYYSSEKFHAKHCLETMIYSADHDSFQRITVEDLINNSGRWEQDGALSGRHADLAANWRTALTDTGFAPKNDLRIDPYLHRVNNTFEPIQYWIQQDLAYHGSEELTHFAQRAREHIESHMLKQDTRSLIADITAMRALMDKLAAPPLDVNGTFSYFNLQFSAWLMAIADYNSTKSNAAGAYLSLPILPATDGGAIATPELPNIVVRDVAAVEAAAQAAYNAAYSVAYAGAGGALNDAAARVAGAAAGEPAAAAVRANVVNLDSEGGTIVSSTGDAYLFGYDPVNTGVAAAPPNVAAGNAAQRSGNMYAMRLAKAKIGTVNLSGSAVTDARKADISADKGLVQASLPGLPYGCSTYAWMLYFAKLHDHNLINSKFQGETVRQTFREIGEVASKGVAAFKALASVFPKMFMENNLLLSPDFCPSYLQATSKQTNMETCAFTNLFDVNRQGLLVPSTGFQSIGAGALADVAGRTVGANDMPSVAFSTWDETATPINATGNTWPEVANGIEKVLLILNNNQALFAEGVGPNWKQQNAPAKWPTGLPTNAAARYTFYPAANGDLSSDSLGNLNSAELPATALRFGYGFIQGELLKLLLPDMKNNAERDQLMEDLRRGVDTFLRGKALKNYKKTRNYGNSSEVSTPLQLLNNEFANVPVDPSINGGAAVEQQYERYAVLISNLVSDLINNKLGAKNALSEERLQAKAVPLSVDNLTELDTLVSYQPKAPGALGGLNRVERAPLRWTNLRMSINPVFFHQIAEKYRNFDAAAGNPAIHELFGTLALPFRPAHELLENAPTSAFEIMQIANIAAGGGTAQQKRETIQKQLRSFALARAQPAARGTLEGSLLVPSTGAMSGRVAGVYERKGDDGYGNRAAGFYGDTNPPHATKMLDPYGGGGLGTNLAAGGYSGESLANQPDSLVRRYRQASILNIPVPNSGGNVRLNTNAVKRLEIIDNEINDPVERAMALLYCMSPVHRNQFTMWLKHNCPIPASFFVFQPHQTFRMGSALLYMSSADSNTPTFDGPDNITTAGITMYNYFHSAPRYIAARDSYYWRFKGHMGSAIVLPSLMHLDVNLFYRQYLSGMNAKEFYDPDLLEDQWNEESKVFQKSNIVVQEGARLTRRDIKDPIDISGRPNPTVFPREVQSELGEHNRRVPDYPSAPYYNWTLYHFDTLRDTQRKHKSLKEIKKSGYVNTLCFQMNELKYDPMTNRFGAIEIPSTGHITKHFYPGMRDVFDGTSAQLEDRTNALSYPPNM